MPIFNYQCRSCGEVSELLVPRFDSAVSCPQCGSPEMDKQPSAFCAPSAPSHPAHTGCAHAQECAESAGGHSCCGGNCACHHH